MRNALKQDRPIVAITADLRSFYHEVSAEYLLAPGFLDYLRPGLNKDDLLFTVQLVQALRTWAASTPEHKEEPDRGLPVGLSASRVIANVILCEFDRFILCELAPLYYGRYVDDVFLVLDNRCGMESSEAVWGLMIERSNGLLRRGADNGAIAYWLDLEYSPNSRLRFVGDKQKIFLLTGNSGQLLVESINRTVLKRSSDWRLLPDLPVDADELAADFLATGRDTTEEVDNLRKADGISVQRLAFAIRLRNFEAVQRDLRPEQWMSHRDRFFRLVLDYIVTPTGIFAYGPYIARLVGLAAACGDWENAAAVVKRLAEVFRLVGETAEANANQLESSRESLLRASFESAAKALSTEDAQGTGLNKLLTAFQNAEFETPNADDLRKLSIRLFVADLARDAYRDVWLDEGKAVDQLKRKEMSVTLPMDVMERLHLDDVREFLKETGRWKAKRIPRAAAFPTRPLSYAEITLLDRKCLTDFERFRRWVRALRGVELPDNDDVHNASRKLECSDHPNIIVIPYRALHSEPLVALPCFLTKDESWTAAVTKTPDPDSERYFRLSQLINEVLAAQYKAQYLILPELALPRRLFNRFAHKLTRSGVSLIAGLEYLHWGTVGRSGSEPFVSNQVYASLVTDILGYLTPMIYIQEKERPSLEEERDLFKIAGKELKPKWEMDKPVIQHGGFFFGILICSELTNIDYRRKFRGQVDALFIPEWNKDTNSFSALVEASALDVHCFVVQSNNRKYGDCRIRAPYRDGFRRDVVRVKGGDNDYFVLGRIGAAALRAFQSHHRSPDDGQFKPVPDGFHISPERRCRPK